MFSEISFLESIFPNQDSFMEFITFIILILGFFRIVVLSKKYRYLFDYLERFF